MFEVDLPMAGGRLIKKKIKTTRKQNKIETDRKQIF